MTASDRAPAGGHPSAPRHPDYGVCPACGYLMLPVLDLLPCGHDGPPGRAPLDAVGTVYSWTQSWAGPDDATIIVMADFFDGALRVSAPLFGSGEIAIGDRVVAAADARARLTLRRLE